MMIYANHYYNFGFNVTHISSERSSIHKKEQTVLKSPSHTWEKYIHNRQTIEELHSLKWDEASGIGTILGYNNLRALDVDGCQDLSVIRDFLIMLNLPDDYQWVNISGSKKGFHIIFYADEHHYVSKEGTAKAFRSNRIYEKRFRYMELRWLGNLMLPPSMHPSDNRYEYFNKKIPNSKPYNLELSVIEKAVSYFCEGHTLVEESTSGYWLDVEGRKILPLIGTNTFVYDYRDE